MKGVSVPIGLLSRSQGKSQDPDMNVASLADHVEDDLPSVSEAFGIPSGLISGPFHPLQSSTLNMGSSSRFSVRATTFDGRTLYIKRRPKTSHEARNVSTLLHTKSNLINTPLEKRIRYNRSSKKWQPT